MTPFSIEAPIPPQHRARWATEAELANTPKLPESLAGSHHSLDTPLPLSPRRLKLCREMLPQLPPSQRVQPTPTQPQAPQIPQIPCFISKRMSNDTALAATDGHQGQGLKKVAKHPFKVLFSDDDPKYALGNETCGITQYPRSPQNDAYLKPVQIPFTFKDEQHRAVISAVVSGKKPGAGNLANYFVKELPIHVTELLDANLQSMPIAMAIPQSLKSGFEVLSSLYFVVNGNNPNRANDTASAVVLLRHEDKIYVANAGNARAVLIKKNGSYVSLTCSNETAIGWTSSAPLPPSITIAMKGTKSDDLSRGLCYYQDGDAMICISGALAQATTLPELAQAVQPALEMGIDPQVIADKLIAAIPSAFGNDELPTDNAIATVLRLS